MRVEVELDLGSALGTQVLLLLTGLHNGSPIFKRLLDLPHGRGDQRTELAGEDHGRDRVERHRTLRYLTGRLDATERGSIGDQRSGHFVEPLSALGVTLGCNRGGGCRRTRNRDVDFAYFAILG